MDGQYWYYDQISVTAEDVTVKVDVLRLWGSICVQLHFSVTGDTCLAGMLATRDRRGDTKLDISSNVKTSEVDMHGLRYGNCAMIEVAMWAWVHDNVQRVDGWVRENPRRWGSVEFVCDLDLTVNPNEGT